MTSDGTVPDPAVGRAPHRRAKPAGAGGAIRVLRAADHRRMRWKNGKGETVEIALHPPSAGLDDFEWRVSMARVETDGPFSVFPGIDRTLSILDGEGFELTVEDDPAIVLTRETSPHFFRADKATQARLIAGPVTDLNVMVRRSAWCHAVSRLDLAVPARLDMESGICLLLVASGRVALERKGERLELGVDDCAMTQASHATRWSVSPLPRACLYQIRFFANTAQGEA